MRAFVVGAAALCVAMAAAAQGVPAATSTPAAASSAASAAGRTPGVPKPAASAASAPLARPAARPASAVAACPQPEEVAVTHLYGLWRAEYDGSWHAATLLIERHPEFAQSFRGSINRNGERSLVAGDIEEGEFTLEESADGQRIAATWLGDVVAGSCGREIRGTWTREGDATQRRFVLRKVDR